MSAQMRLPNAAPTVPANLDGPLLKGLPHTTGFSDAFGDRQLVFDPTAGISLEVLRFKREFSDSKEFEAALTSRAEVLSHLQHPSIALIHTVGRHEKAGLVLVTKHTAGRRVSELLPKAQGPAFALELIRLVTPALAALQRTGEGVAHGALSPERIIVTRDGRLVLVEHVLGSAIESLGPSRSRLIQLGLVAPAGADPVKLDGRTDMAQLGFIALSLLLGRKLEPADYPDQVPALLDEIGNASGSPAVAAKLRSWLERAMQLSPKSFANARDAQAAFHDLPDDEDVQSKSTATATSSPASSSSTLVAFPSESSSASRGSAKPAVAAPKPPSDGKSRMGLYVGGGLGLAGAAAAVVFFGLPYFKQPAQSTQTTQPPPRVETASATIPLTTPTASPAVGGVPTQTPAAGPAGAPIQSPVPPAARTTPTPTPTQTPLASTANLAQPTAAPTPLPAGPRFGGMTVKAAIDLQIYKDGTLVGASSAPIAVNEGTHTLEVVNEATGFKMRQTVNVKAGQMTTLNIALPTARVSVNAVPWAEVEIDGKAAGETPLANLSLPIGPHEFTFRHPELGVKKQTVVVKVDGQTRVTQLFK